MISTISFILSIQFLFLSSLLSAQINTGDKAEKGTERSAVKFGEPVIELPFSARLYKTQISNADEFIKSLKSTFAGKALYIDFWGTWCSPCIEAMPNNKRMYFETKDLPIEFIYICISSGSSPDQWITKISVMKQPGIHIFADHDLVYGMMKLFNVGGFPSYVFIDKSGEYKSKAVPANSSTTSNKLRQLITK